MIPKQGDNGYLKNWRPISLLCSDLNIFTRCILNRLTNVLPEIIHVDQSYTIEKRSIYNNIHLIRDAINFSISNINNLPLAIVYLDQSKAFDRVNHDYLFRTLRAFDCIALAYTCTESLLKINGSLTAPFDFKRVIRQGVYI